MCPMFREIGMVRELDALHPAIGMEDGQKDSLTVPQRGRLRHPNAEVHVAEPAKDELQSIDRIDSERQLWEPFSAADPFLLVIERYQGEARSWLNARQCPEPSGPRFRGSCEGPQRHRNR